MGGAGYRRSEDLKIWVAGARIWLGIVNLGVGGNRRSEDLKIWASRVNGGSKKPGVEDLVELRQQRGQES